MLLLFWYSQCNVCADLSRSRTFMNLLSVHIISLLTGKGKVFFEGKQKKANCQRIAESCSSLAVR
ncbi:hypothetical protein D7X87_06700 [bacterium D16-54]|nr:hypothetical protein D7X87_06700 [bacterium D16-54]RKJ15749.1 hypothetical protein D7X65_06695 [bacterium D16-56]